MKHTMKSNTMLFLVGADPSAVTVDSQSRVYRDRNVVWIIWTQPVPKFCIDPGVGKVIELMPLSFFQ